MVYIGGDTVHFILVANDMVVETGLLPEWDTVQMCHTADTCLHATNDRSQ